MALFFYQFTPLYGHNRGNAGLSVKCVLITDKSSKTAALSVNLNEILDKLVEQYCI